MGEYTKGLLESQIYIPNTEQQSNYLIFVINYIFNIFVGVHCLLRHWMGGRDMLKKR